MSDKRIGPRITVKASCDGCVHERSVDYAVQGDSGFRVYCAHPLRGASHPEHPGKRIGDTTWDTPTWCPEMPPSRPALSPDDIAALRWLADDVRREAVRLADFSYGANALAVLDRLLEQRK